MPSALTRRSLARLLGATTGAALLDSRLTEAMFAAVRAGAPGNPIRLNANENPYGPCASSLEALARSAATASRYPMALENEVRQAIARHHDVVPRQRRLLNDTRRWLCAELERDRRRYIPSEANFVMIDVEGDVAPVTLALRDRGILAGRKFHSMPSFLRVSIGKREEMEAFLAGLRQIVPARAAA